MYSGHVFVFLRSLSCHDYWSSPIQYSVRVTGSSSVPINQELVVSYEMTNSSCDGEHDANVVFDVYGGELKEGYGQFGANI